VLGRLDSRTNNRERVVGVGVHQVLPRGDQRPSFGSSFKRSDRSVTDTANA
jgi:hypothetical protein